MSFDTGEQQISSRTECAESWNAGKTTIFVEFGITKAKPTKFTFSLVIAESTLILRYRIAENEGGAVSLNVRGILTTSIMDCIGMQEKIALLV